ncbi:MAG: M28 family peptidase [Prolixibacteraceae bacterium]|jgi:hypothetical protein|nr:M28 family peptidase [Prolixibacteraceae bacterium]
MFEIKRLFLFLLIALSTLCIKAQNTYPVIDSLIHLITVDSYKSHFDSLRADTFCNRKVQASLEQSSDHDACRDYIYHTFKKYLGEENTFIHSFKSGDHCGLANVLGFKKGTKQAERIWIISAHYDTNNNHETDEKSEKISPGANDNGTGLAAILEIARIVSNLETEASILFAAWDFEEEYTNGYPTGSNNWYLEHVKHRMPTQWDSIGKGGYINYKSISGNINFDMFGNPQVFRNNKPILWTCYANNKHIEFADNYTKTINNYTSDILAITFGRLILSDHYTFAAKKIKAVENLESGYRNDPYYHTYSDNLQNKDNINFNFATSVTQGGFAFLLENILAFNMLIEQDILPKLPIYVTENPNQYHFDTEIKKGIQLIYDQYGKLQQKSLITANTGFAPKTDGLYRILLYNGKKVSQRTILLHKKEGLF